MNANPEWRLLRALCQATDASVRERAAKLLRRHRWREREHEVIFAAWNHIARPGRPVLRGELAAQLTRAGFPEMDLDSLFEPLPSPATDLGRLLDELPDPIGAKDGW
jgi:hypothetical protein